MEAVRGPGIENADMSNVKIDLNSFGRKFKVYSFSFRLTWSI